jgi:hypothetical protein
MATSKPRYVIRHLPTDRYLYWPKSQLYRFDYSWTRDLESAYLIGSDRQITTTINKMRRASYDERYDQTLPNPYGEYRYNPAFGREFNPADFKVEEVVIQTTGNEVPF